MLDYHIDPMVIDDFDEVMQLWTTTEGMGLSESDSRHEIEAYLTRNPGLSLTARLEDGRLVGTVLCGHDGRRGYLYHLAVAADCRRQGMARALLDCCLANLQALGIRKATVFVYHANALGQAFWQHNGWKGRVDLYVMQRPLR
jgi:N-acetylglutamate synthase